MIGIQINIQSIVEEGLNQDIDEIQEKEERDQDDGHSVGIGGESALQGTLTKEFTEDLIEESNKGKKKGIEKKSAKKS